MNMDSHNTDAVQEVYCKSDLFLCIVSSCVNLSVFDFVVNSSFFDFQFYLDGGSM